MRDLVQQMEGYGDREALVIDDERITYRELARSVMARQEQLASAGLRRRGRVGLLMPNSIDLVTTLLAAWASGAVAVPINTRYRAQDLAFVVAHSEVELVVTTAPASSHAPDLPGRLLEAFPALSSTGGAALAAAPHLRSVLLASGPDLETWSAAATAPRSEAGTDVDDEGRDDEGGDDDLLLIYTSGTTANPKGCVHDVSAFLETARLTAETMGAGEGDVVWDPLPLFHTGGLLPLLGALDHGATFCSTTHFEPDAALAMLERERVTAAYPAFSTLITALLDAPTFAATDLSSLRWILAIGPARLLERLQEAVPSARQVSCYGCTEVGGVVVYNSVDDPATDRANTSGRPFPGVQVEIADPFGKPVAQGETGEILVRGPGVLRRYHREEADPVDEQGRFHTGDLGHLDERGQLVFTGRLKDMLKVGGENVAASEIEFVLSQHPSVTLAAVVPVPDDRLDEVPAAFVELRPGHTADPDEIMAFCAARLASFKVPRYVHFVTTWPMSATKIQKFRLRELLPSRLTSAGGSR